MRSLKLAVLPGAEPPGDDAEARLIRASQDGDAEAFARLYGRYRGALYGVCLRRLRDPSLAEDAVQDTFLRAFTNLSRFELGKPIWPWLSSIAERRCIDLHRRGAKTSFVDDVGRVEATDGSWRERSADTTLEAVIAGEERGRLKRALAGLPRRQRRVLLLHALEGWNLSDIASAERATVGSVKSMLFRARATVRQACEAGVLGAVLLPVRRLRRTVQRAVDRVRLEAQMAGEGLLAGSAQSLSTGALALTMVLAGGLPGGVSSGREAGSPARITHSLPPAAVEAPSDPAVAGPGAPGSEPRQPVDAAAEYLESEVVDPARDETPESARVTSFAISANYSSDRTLFAAGQCFARWSCRVLFASRDGGASWTRLPAKSFVGDTLLLPPTYPLDARIFAMGPAGLQESRDGGASFRVVNPLVGGVAISPAFESDPRILIGTAAVVEYWADRGLMKPAPLAALSTSSYSTIAFSPAYPADRVILVGGIRPDPTEAPNQSAVYRCDGSVCAGAGLPGSVGGGPSLRLSPGFARDGIAYAFTYNRLFASADGGRSFQRLPVLVGEAGGLTDLAISPGPALPAPSMFAAVERQGRSGSGGVYRSVDWGRSWARLPVALPGFRLGALRVIVTPTGRLLAAGISGGIACSEDGGHTWRTRCAPEA